MSKVELDELIDIPGIAAATGVLPGTLRQWLNRGKISPIIRFTSTPLFLVSELRDEIALFDKEAASRL